MRRIMAGKKVKRLTHDKRLQILRLHYEGCTQAEISAETGVAPSVVWRAVNDERTRLTPESDDALQALLQETYQRLLFYEQQAIRRHAWRAAMDNRMAIVKLFGLAKPDKTELSGGVTMRQMQPVYMPPAALADGEVRDDDI